MHTLTMLPYVESYSMMLLEMEAEAPAKGHVRAVTEATCGVGVTTGWWGGRDIRVDFLRS